MIWVVAPVETDMEWSAGLDQDFRTRVDAAEVEIDRLFAEQRFASPGRAFDDARVRARRRADQYCRHCGIGQRIVQVCRGPRAVLRR